MTCCTFSSSCYLSNIVSTLLEKLSMQVLKMQPRDQVKVGIVNGPFGQATVLHTHPDVVLECHLWQSPPTLGQLYLVLAMPRPKVCNMITHGIIAMSSVVLAMLQLPTCLCVYKNHQNHKATQVMKRLWSTLACLGVTRVYITGAEKVEKVYFASHALKPERFYPELIHGRHLPCHCVLLNPTRTVTK